MHRATGPFLGQNLIIRLTLAARKPDESGGMEVLVGSHSMPSTGEVENPSTALF
jgi:hypothetical protein